MDLHPQIAHLAFLLGTWRGGGDGDYPTIEPFSYLEEVVFAHVGKPFISYSQKTRDAETELPLHTESGYLRPVGLHGVELVLSQPSGIVEMHEGSVHDGVIELHSTQVLTTPTAKSVTEVHRHLHVDGPVLTYDLAMAAVGLELNHHLTARLLRQE